MPDDEEVTSDENNRDSFTQLRSHLVDGEEDGDVSVYDENEELEEEEYVNNSIFLPRTRLKYYRK